MDAFRTDDLVAVLDTIARNHREYCDTVVYIVSFNNQFGVGFHSGGQRELIKQYGGIGEILLFYRTPNAQAIEQEFHQTMKQFVIQNIKYGKIYDCPYHVMLNNMQTLLTRDYEANRSELMGRFVGPNGTFITSKYKVNVGNNAGANAGAN